MVYELNIWQIKTNIFNAIVILLMILKIMIIITIIIKIKITILRRLEYYILYVVHHMKSILGPLLFILYINDLYFISQFLKSIMFADDTNLLCTNNKIKPLFLKANLELAKISKWLGVNKLSFLFTIFHLHFFIYPKIEIIYPYNYLPLKLIVMKQNNHLQLNFLDF